MGWKNQRSGRIYLHNVFSSTSPVISLVKSPRKPYVFHSNTTHIISYLPLPEMIPFLSLHPTLLSLTRTHLSPIPSIIHHLLNLGPPYPNILAKLPQLSLLLPDDMGTMFIEILVRARPKWILERLEIGRWKDDMWREAFERRFLPSWRRFKGEGDTWRAIFIRFVKLL